jgi:predicted ribosomally synthesized peptide with nif11-like leader
VSWLNLFACLEISMSLDAANQFITKAGQDVEMQKALHAAIQNKTGLEASRAAQGIATSHGFDASAEEIDQVLLSLTGQLSDEDLQGVSGGKGITWSSGAFDTEGEWAKTFAKRYWPKSL